jgi:hypothetical protein
MKLDSNRAWKHASRNVSRNRDALLAVSGVFFLLPQLALSLFYPAPEQTAGMSEQQLIAMTQAYYLSTLPAMIPLVLCQALGTLALLSLLSHAARPTVGEALRLGVGGMLTYLGAQILIGIGLGVGGGLILTVMALSGMHVLILAGLLLALMVAATVALRVSLSPAVVAIEGERNPVRTLRRSWALTAGNAWRLLAFYALFLVATLVLLMIARLFVGIPLQMMAGGATAEIGDAIVSATISALMAMYLVAIIEAVHHQLAGGANAAERETFD